MTLPLIATWLPFSNRTETVGKGAARKLQWYRPRGEVIFVEGSGLSRDNLMTPNATAALLRFMSRHKCAQAYLDALSVAGVDATLKNRMQGTPAAGNVRAKTDTLRWANSLSGYVTTAAGERLVFSLTVFPITKG